MSREYVIKALEDRFELYGFNRRETSSKLLSRDLEPFITIPKELVLGYCQRYNDSVSDTIMEPMEAAMQVYDLAYSIDKNVTSKELEERIKLDSIEYSSVTRYQKNPNSGESILVKTLDAEYCLVKADEESKECLELNTTNKDMKSKTNTSASLFGIFTGVAIGAAVSAISYSYVDQMGYNLKIMAGLLQLVGGVGYLISNYLQIDERFKSAFKGIAFGFILGLTPIHFFDTSNYVPQNIFEDVSAFNIIPQELLDPN